MKRLAAITASIAALFIALGFTAAWRQVELKGFDALSVLTARNESTFPITIVGIDEDSFAQIALQWPWPHGIHARLVDALAQAGALVIAFDVLISDPDRDPEEDKALAAAIARSGNVVLAADMVYLESAHARQWLRVDPLPAFKAAGASTGLARIELDGDSVARRMPLEAEAFWREVARRAAQRQPAITLGEPAAGSMIRYAGPVQTFQYVSFYQALDPSKLPPDALKDQVVIIGKHVRASPDARAAQADLFYTPFTASTGWFTPGAEIHANILETALRGDAIVPLGLHWNVLLVIAGVAAASLAMRRWRPVGSAAMALALIAALGVGTWFLFARFNLWLPAGAAAAAILSVYLSHGALAFLAERRKRAELRRAFSLYVSDEVVDHVIAHPERLVLGGERREVTMLFTDLAGFTTLTEQLGAEQVTSILNMHFSRATAIIKRHRGTVNRFIGDAVMAMWGAPLDDPEQARHACEAACEMQEDMGRLRDELAGRGLPPIWMRVGIHSCGAIVGNLGSAERFDYTAIGDGVNLAARLEGVNKLYGTGILVSGETVRRMQGAIPVRTVDRVIVKGKSEAVEIFTPCSDGELNSLSADAVSAYRARRWEESEGLWREILRRHPSDRIAILYIERIQRCRAASPGVEWQDAVELEKL